MKNIKHKKEILLVLLGVILILTGAYLTAKASNKEIAKPVPKKEETLKVNGQVINLKLYRVDKSFFLQIPDDFVAVTGDALNQKYGTSARAELIFESKDDLTRISVTRGKDDVAEESLASYIETFKNNMVGYTDVKFETYQKYGKNFARIVATSTDESSRYYDIRYFILDNKLVTVEFYTTINQKTEWEKVSKKILDSICFDEEDIKDKN